MLADVFSRRPRPGRRRAAGPLRSARAGGRSRWHPLGNDRFAATFVPDQLGRWQYQVVGWLDHLGTWRHGMELKLAAGVDVTRRPADRRRADRPGDRARPAPADAEALAELRERLLGRRHPGRSVACRPTTSRTATATSPISTTSSPSTTASTSTPCSGGPASASRRRAGPPARRRGRPRAGPVQRVVRVLPPLDAGAGRRPRHAAPTSSTASTTSPSMGFDVLYLPPVHPIGATQRKGRNNTVDAGARRRRQPVGDRRAPRAATPPSTPSSARSTTSASWPPPAASAASSWRSTSPSSARPTTRG